MCANGICILTPLKCSGRVKKSSPCLIVLRSITTRPLSNRVVYTPRETRCDFGQP